MVSVHILGVSLPVGSCAGGSSIPGRNGELSLFPETPTEWSPHCVCEGDSPYHSFLLKALSASFLLLPAIPSQPASSAGPQQREGRN